MVLIQLLTRFRPNSIGLSKTSRPFFHLCGKTFFLGMFMSGHEILGDTKSAQLKQTAFSNITLKYSSRGLTSQWQMVLGFSSSLACPEGVWGAISEIDKMPHLPDLTGSYSLKASSDPMSSASIVSTSSYISVVTQNVTAMCQLYLDGSLFLKKVSISSLSPLTLIHIWSSQLSAGFQ